MRHVKLILFVWALLAAGLLAQRAELVIHGAVVETMDARYVGATAVAAAKGRILCVGSDEEVLALAGEGTRVIDAKGRFLIPGFIESHGHFTGLGASLRTVDLVGCKSIDELISRVRRVAETTDPGTWITGRGWDQNLWQEKRFPHHGRLSAALPRHPVFLRRVDGHAALVNAVAMEKAGIGQGTPSPDGGEVIRGNGGLPTGVLIDKAMGLVTPHLPATGTDVIAGDLLRAQQRCFAEGITSFHDAGSPRSTVAVMHGLMKAGELKIRLYVMLRAGSSRLVKLQAKTAPIIGAHDHRLTVRAFKLSIDGALGSRGAALLEDYSDRPGHKGLLMFDEAELVKVGEAALGGGYQVCVHAIGDRANRTVLDAFQELTVRGLLTAEDRFRIEHAQILDEADIPRFAELGIIASMQGVHCTSDRPWVPTRIGEQRTREGAYAWRRLLDRGVILCNGTDAPVERVSAIECFHASVTRRAKDGTPEERWDADQRMTRREALHSYTAAAAYAAFDEQIKGTISPGKLADFVLLDRDLIRCAETEILGTHVDLTVVGGEVVFER